MLRHKNKRPPHPDKNRVIAFLRKPWLFLGLAAATALSGGLMKALVPDKLGYSIFPEISVCPDQLQSFAVSPGGEIAVSNYSDLYSYLYCADPAYGTMHWLSQAHDLYSYFGPASRRDLIFGDQGELFLHYLTWTEDNNAIETEQVICLDADGLPKQVLCGMDYTDAENPPTREARMTAFRYAGGKLHYAYYDTDCTEFYVVDTQTGTQKMTGRITWQDTFAGRVFAMSDGYLLSMSDGTVCRASEDGTCGETIYTASVSREGSWETDLIVDAAELNGKLYVVESGNRELLYCLENGEAEEVLYMKDTGLFGEEEPVPDIQALTVQGDALYFMTDQAIYSWQNGTLTEVQTSYRLNLQMLIHLIPCFVFTILLILTIIDLVVWLILIRKGLLAKQLLLMIPCISVIMTVLLVKANDNITQLYSQKQTDTMFAVGDLCRGRLDGDELQRIGQESDPSAYRKYEALMLEFAGYNRGLWNGGLDFSLCIPVDEEYCYVYADSRKSDIPFAELDGDFMEDYRRDGQEAPEEVLCYSTRSNDNPVSTMYGINETAYMSIAPVMASDGTVSAFLKVTTDSYYFQSDKWWYPRQLFWTAFRLSLLLLAVTSVIAAIMSHSLRRAAATVSKIAEGDFTVRNDARSKDEIGEICRQVDRMADSLNTMFAEKDANEKFYYKFVPEKFRELLGKERITDLELGDAQSREFTVLFCDIRSFSLNSEMLTVKENFEFVNIIYGIAGPIIRSHGGFVDKYIGDAVMALFESADDAVQAGIAIYHAVVRDPETAERLHVSDINIGIGIHTGMARIGIVGEEERLSGTVISDTVNLSSRLESLTKTYHTAMLISKETLDKMERPEEIGMRYLGMVQVAGVKEVRSLYEVLDCLDAESRAVREQNAPQLREAIRLFHMGERRRAEALLEEMQDAGTSDPVVTLYTGYLRDLEGGDTVFRFVRK